VHRTIDRGSAAAEAGAEQTPEHLHAVVPLVAAAAVSHQHQRLGARHVGGPPKHAGDDLAIALDGKFAFHDAICLYAILYPSDRCHLCLSSLFAYFTIELVAKKALPLFGINDPWAVLPRRMMA
jgi:hypothetical protein